MTGALLLTYQPPAERDTAARLGAGLARRFGRDAVVIAPHLRPTRLATARAVVAMIGRGDAGPDLSPWVADLRAAAESGAPVVVVLIDGATRPPAPLWPNDAAALAKAPVLALSTDALERKIGELIAALDALPDPSERPPATASSVVVAATEAAFDRDPAVGAIGVVAQPRVQDPRISGVSMAQAAAIPDQRPMDADLEALAANRFSARPDPAVVPPPLAAPVETVPDVRGAAAIAADPKPAGPPDRDFAPRPRPLASSPAARPRPPLAPPPAFEPPRRRGWIAAAVTLVIVVAGAALAYVFRDAIEARIGPIVGPVFDQIVASFKDSTGGHPPATN